MERQRYRRGDVLAASGEELIFKFSPCAVLPGIYQNSFLNSTLLNCFVFCFFLFLRRRCPVYGPSRVSLATRTTALEVWIKCRASVECSLLFFLSFFFYALELGATFLTLTLRVLVSWSVFFFLLRVCHASVGCDRGCPGERVDARQ